VSAVASVAAFGRFTLVVFFPAGAFALFFFLLLAHEFVKFVELFECGGA
jgi:hypothetical protein